MEVEMEMAEVEIVYMHDISSVNITVASVTSIIETLQMCSTPEH